MRGSFAVATVVRALPDRPGHEVMHALGCSTRSSRSLASRLFTLAAVVPMSRGSSTALALALAPIAIAIAIAIATSTSSQRWLLLLRCCARRSARTSSCLRVHVEVALCDGLLCVALRCQSARGLHSRQPSKQALVDSKSTPSTQSEREQLVSSRFVLLASFCLRLK